MSTFARSLPADQANNAATLPARAAASAGSAPSTPFAGQACPRCNGSGHARVGMCRRCHGEGWLVTRAGSREMARQAMHSLCA
jgi:hypothetical protein